MSNNKLSEFVQDTKQLKLDIQEDKPNTPFIIKDFLLKQRWKIAFLGLLGLVIYNQEWYQFEIPEIAYLFVSASIVTVVIVYPYARYVARWFIKDNRVPIFAIDPIKPHDIELWYVPQERIADIDVKEGKLNELQTKEGTGYEVLEFGEYTTDNGRKKLYAVGNWIGEKSGLELRRNIESIKDMRENLTPLAKKGMRYDVKWPSIIHNITSSITNWLIHDFQQGINYKGDELYNQIQQIINEQKPIDEQDEQDEQDTIEVDENDLAELTQILNNGEQVQQTEKEVKANE